MGSNVRVYPQIFLLILRFKKETIISKIATISMPSFSRRDRERPFPCLSSLAHALKHECHFLADVVLYVKDTNTTFPCHGLVLEARSPRFRQMLYRARCGHSHSAECFLTRCKYILELDHPFSVSLVKVAVLLK